MESVETIVWMAIILMPLCKVLIAGVPTIFLPVRLTALIVMKLVQGSVPRTVLPMVTMGTWMCKEAREPSPCLLVKPVV